MGNSFCVNSNFKFVNYLQAEELQEAMEQDYEIGYVVANDEFSGANILPNY